MMRWSRKKTDPKDAERERRLVDAEREAAQLRERADRVARSLKERLRHNHWGDTVAAIARRER